MVRPEPQRPFEGLISIHCELSPMASTEYEPGRYVCLHHVTRRRPPLNPLPPSLPSTLLVPPAHRQSDEEIALARMLDKIFRRSDTVDREALCILAGERVRLPTFPLCPHTPTNQKTQK
jgi:exosome complex component RRP45